MTIRSLSIPDFLGGVSQQSAPQRLQNQVERADNAWSSPQDGLVKRHPTLHAAVIDAQVGDLDRLLHPIDRDASEQYVVDITHTGIRVFSTITGDEVPVVLEDGSDPDFTYLSVIRTDLFDDHEDFGDGWTLTDLFRTVGDFRGPYSKGRARLYTPTGAGLATATQVLNVLGVSAPAGDTWGMGVHFKQDPDAANDADVTLSIEFNDAGFPLANAVFTWSAGELTVGATSWTGTDLGDIYSSVIDRGDGWYQAVIVVQTNDIIAGREGWISLPAGAATRSVAVFGAQFIRNCPVDPDLFPSYYLDTVRGAISAATFADTTFISNRAVPIAFTEDAEAEDASAGALLVWIRQGAYAARYRIRVVMETTGGSGTTTSDVTVTTTLADGTTAPTVPGDATSGDADPTVIASTFDPLLSADLTDATVGTSGSIITILPDTGFDVVYFEVEDSLNGGIVAFLRGGSVESMEDLPTRIPNGGVHLKVTGVASRPEDDFWVEFVPTDTSLGGDGEWEESIEPGTLTTLDPASMPHVLVRRQDDQDGTATGVPGSLFFSFEEYEWADRQVGDSLTNPLDALNGAYVGDIGFFRSRFYMVLGRSVVLSEINDPGSLFRTTVRSLPDSDPIHLEIPDRNVAAFHHAVPLERELTVFSDSAVYRIGGDPVLTPSTASADTALELTTDRDARPLRFGDTIVAFGRAEDQTTVYQVVVPESEQALVAFSDLTAPVPDFITGRAAHAAASSASGAVLIAPFEDPTALFHFQEFLTPGRERVQAAWFRHPFPDEVTLVGVAFIRRRACLVLERAGIVCLEFMDVAPLPQDADLGYSVRLDRRLTQDQLGGAVYDVGTDTTTFTAPYTFQEQGAATGAGRPAVVTFEGRRPEVVGTTFNTVTVLGDWTGTDLWVGERYDMVVTLTRPFFRVPDGQGGIRPYLGGPQRAVSLALQYEDSAHFQLVISPPLRAEQRLVWNTPLGVGAQLGPAELVSGTQRVHVLAMNQDAIVSIENPSPYPSRLTSAEWELDVHPRS